MAKCTRCRVELNGPARFCASCGAPVPEADRRDAGPGTITGTPADSASSATTMEPHISIQVLDPSLPVNPFASTASPNSNVNPFATTKKPSIENKPSEPPPVVPTPVSPLATSASLPDRGAFEELMAAQADPKPAPASLPKKKPPGTQMMNNAPVRPSTPAPAPSPAAPPAKKAVARTVAMGNWPAPKPASAPAQSAAAPVPAPSVPRMPVSVAAPSALASGAAASSGLGSGQVVPSAQPSYPQAPSGPGGWGWNAPPRPVVPGARVNVTWSNGQRYPATVNQINGSRCLVVFPDGQQHWVESQFVSAV